MEAPAPVVLQPLPDLSLVPPTDTPEAAFDLIAAANLQPAAALEDAAPVDATLDPTPEPEAEKPEADPEDDLLTCEAEESVDLAPPKGEDKEELVEEEVVLEEEGEEIPLEEEEEV